MRALLGQLQPVPGDPGANAARVAEALEAHPDAELAIFPELYLCGYDPEGAAGLAIEAGDARLERIAGAAARHGTAVVVGFAERIGDGVANAVAAIDADGTARGTYRKTHLFGDRERAAFVPGDALRLFTLAGATVAPLICFDAEFPEPARALARAGADLFVTVAANMAPYEADHALCMRARALDNRRPHLYVNRVGDEAGCAFVGGSAAIASDGAVLHASGRDEQVLVVDVPLAGAASPDVDYLAAVRTDLVVEPATPVPANEGGER